MRLVFAGTPEVAVPALEALHASRHEVVAVVTRPDARSGRGRTVAQSPVRSWAQDHDVEALTPATPRDPAFLDRLRELAPDACPVVAYGALVPRVALDIPTHGWVNLHFSLLPAWRGAAPVQHAVMAGDEVTGASTFLIEEGLDTGPVYGVMTERVRPTDTTGDLLGRLAEGGAGLLVATMDGIEDGSLQPVPQSSDGVSLAPKLDVADARVRWELPAVAVDRLVRGCTPAPGAWTTFRGERLKLAPVSPERGDAVAQVPHLAPGELHAGKRDVWVGTATTPVRLTQVRPHGKKEMAAADWARGVRITAGECLDDGGAA
ncbi:methionyl-tRNA formyltransferase [Phycicoccus sp. Soil748]|uniref:methionyl-tRNA formyltransferase n=1 Tax=Phycicoccus sp. Soil748 TaxID=1736397 RepID=UPI000702EAB4|nr:methionyl-tRNA formyltransferase [Phycicoccus sp. Soil748]KRE52859.1 methionyl-tRNA formyltransferase [Phycicoccus sp. Soil748]